MFVDAPSERDERLCDTCQIRPWLNARLIREPNAWPVDEWHPLDILGIESQIIRERRICLQIFTVVIGVVRRHVQISIDPFERSLNGVLPNHLVDRGDRGKARIPHGLCVIASESFDEFTEPYIG